MKKWLYLLILVLSLCAAIMWWWHDDLAQPAKKGHARVNASPLTNEPITPLPLSVDLDAGKVALGERLFQDPILSHDNSFSCSTCHSLTTGGTDNLVMSVGVHRQIGSVNTPTVFNSSLNFRQFWDGRAETLEVQLDGPTQDPREMASNWVEIVAKLGQSPEYVRSFNQEYTDGIQRDNVKDALATFERSLITPNSRFDRYLLGDSNALTAEEKEGYRLFKEYGCASCHQGMNVGGNLFQKFGVMSNQHNREATKADLGRFNVTGLEADKFVFKVPGLRNVALTAPYLHNGSAEQLEEVVTIMSVTQLGRRLTTSETDFVVMFLRTLSGEYKGKAL
jgi:cytochrome c peroxidase